MKVFFIYTLKMDSDYETITIPNLTKFVIDCFLAANVPLKHSQAMAASIIESDTLGHEAYGLFMLENCILDVKSGIIDTSATPKIDKESSAVAWVDGKNSLGPIVASFSMKLAIQKAKDVGAAIVVAKHSNSFGAGGRYSKLALDEGLIGWVGSNTEPCVVPCRAKNTKIGANPLSLGAPGLLGDYFLLDMSTSVKSPNGVNLKGAKKEYLPLGFAVNAAVLPETNSDVAGKAKHFLPLGSEEGKGSYKGTGLSLMIDILCGVLGGSYYGSEVGMVRWQNIRRKANISHYFIVIDPKRFAPEFEVRLCSLMNYLRNLDPGNHAKPVRMAGDHGRHTCKDVTDSGVIRYPHYVIRSINNLAKMLKIERVKFVPKPVIVALTSSQDLARLQEELRAKNLEEQADAEQTVSVYSMEEDISERLSVYSVYEADEDSIDWMLE